MAKFTYKRRPHGSLEQATEALIAACGGLTAAAALPGCPVGRTMLFRYTDADAEVGEGGGRRSMPAALVGYLESVAGKPFVSAWLAARTGHLLLGVEDVDQGEVEIDLARIGETTAATFADFARAIADRRIDGSEAWRIEGDLDRLIAAALAAKSDLREIQDASRLDNCRPGFVGAARGVTRGAAPSEASRPVPCSGTRSQGSGI